VLVGRRGELGGRARGGPERSGGRAVRQRARGGGGGGAGRPGLPGSGRPGAQRRARGGGGGAGPPGMARGAAGLGPAGARSSGRAAVGARRRWTRVGRERSTVFFHNFGSGIWAVARFRVRCFAEGPDPRPSAKIFYFFLKNSLPRATGQALGKEPSTIFFLVFLAQFFCGATIHCFELNF